ncbi:acyl CoA:acetate/3-ketoacid CoA transferase [Mycobacterium sp. CBMA293]|uniref:acyl CoA:acetate/3-ketoacid CoA transferase n=1 Tax=unclassified Mycolicibacterium TaxID=2636767 RepID=UPI0012DF44D4|nr:MULTISPECIES: CoA-transferase [unclassified Mycolicibacterium]MUL49780.1 acyl CoA:acetate/3-ketoacid CoA transferase [Mycolicibacterium sp. CBMA 360]MUL58557.1 acyl CoA:acetate/3-ketoacid CoA transferase [Mycolicibacterium sp. CBMA 335]MUL74015.1 acyl CoA:acetate/3-ketoacid CoA transferase [Mycolicibacterium sp. CBMA 311]MUL93440.1 acyl CoA:acetate/3-ketoacid CoA transferase [Mycolicibacterium sp. CBMA 230]MUM04656.1 acyl CoA:acetate/3-ketoacid CoA transferase [Mycolicibacterium sp. CBMA 21
MEIDAASLSGLTPRDKIVTAAEAVALIRDGDTVVAEGFAGQCFAEELTLALEARFLQSGSPRDLTLAFAVAQGDRQGRGFDRLCYEGLLKRAIGGHWGMSGDLGKMAVDNKIEAYNLPQGVIAQLFRDSAAGKPGLLTRVGLGTFVDPRQGGGKINEATTADRVELMSVGGEEYLFYKAFERLDVAFLRGTTADPNGNITMEHEGLYLESLAVATAVHNAGGLVIVQVQRIAERGALSAQDVKIPGVLVDCVVVSTPEHHTQTWGTTYSAALSGELRVPLSSVPPLPMSVRKVIARRAAMELRPNGVVNLGIGIPEGIASVAAEEQLLDYLVLTAEPGVIGGMPTGGTDFGCAINGDAILDQPAQFDFYDGGGLDAAFLGMAQADAQGNVNVSRFGPKLAGSGGFINISQNAKKVVFLGSFMAPARTTVVDGKIVIGDGVAAPKFLENVEQRTFSGQYAAAAGRSVLYVTERCVFRLTPNGLELIEIAPGVDLDKDVLAHVGFTPLIHEAPKLMDVRIFRDEPMGLKEELLTVPMEVRFTYDAERDMFFINMEGMSLHTQEEAEAIVAEIEKRLAAVGKKVPVVVNYDNFYLSPALADYYASAVRGLAERYYENVTRYTTSSFMRLKLSGHLSQRGLAPHIYESQHEALDWLNQ